MVLNVMVRLVSTSMALKPFRFGPKRVQLGPFVKLGSGNRLGSGQLKNSFGQRVSSEVSRPSISSSSLIPERSSHERRRPRQRALVRR